MQNYNELMFSVLFLFFFFFLGFSCSVVFCFVAGATAAVFAQAGLLLRERHVL